MTDKTKQADEIWECLYIADEGILFSVKNEDTQEVIFQTIPRVEFPAFMEAGGYPAIMANALLLSEKTGWKFRKISNGNIYLDGSSTSGNPNSEYHPIKDWS